MELRFKVNEQIIEHLTKDKNVVANSKNYLSAQFEFSEEWKDIPKTAIFTAATGKAFKMVLENDACPVPHEVIKSPHFTVSVFGGDLITANVAVVNVIKSGYKDGETSQPPTPDVYAQILDKMTHTEEIAVNMSEEEKSRVASENQRVLAERERALAETSRNKSEQNRIAAENQRASAEGQREILKEEMETLKGETNQAKDDVLAEIEKAQTATDKANSAATHQPIIGDNNNWYVWDIEKAVYVDTGILAKTNIVQTTGDSERDAMSQKATTDALVTLANKVAPSPASVTLYADRWEQDEEDIRYHQEVVVANATITPMSKVDLQLSSEQIVIFYEKDLAFVAENDNGVVTVYCIGQVPENDYIIQATVSEVIVNGE